MSLTGKRQIGQLAPFDLAMLRQAGCLGVEGMDYAVPENNGAISAVRRQE